MVKVVEVQGKKDLQKFVDLPYAIYRDDPNWVAPLRFYLLGTLKALLDPPHGNARHSCFLAHEGPELLGRIAVGIDQETNTARGAREGYISLFECVNSYAAAGALFDRAAEWLKDRGMNLIKGPNSINNTDECRGLLVQGFDGPPAFLNSYNPAYYSDFFDQYGFEKHTDLYSFHVNMKHYNPSLFKESIERAMKRFSVRIDPVSFWGIDHQITDIKAVLDLAWPKEWPDMVPDSIPLQELRKIARKLRWVADMDGIMIARSGDRPVGFVMAFPDYNRAIKHMNGRLTPGGMLKFLWFKRKIRTARIYALFVIPEFRRKVVTEALFYRLMAEGKKYRFVEAEGSIVGEENRVMLQTAEALGGKKYRTYRVYKKEL